MQSIQKQTPIRSGRFGVCCVLTKIFWGIYKAYEMGIYLHHFRWEWKGC